MMRRLNDEETALLIQFVQGRECLWNENNADFKRVSVTRKLWEEIGDQLNMTGDETKSKWRNLKDKFRRQLRQVQEENSNPALASGNSGTPWKFYDEMLFLTDPMHLEPFPANGRSTPLSNNSEIHSAVVELQEYDIDFLVGKGPPDPPIPRGGRTLPRSQWAFGGTKRKADDQEQSSPPPTADCVKSPKETTSTTAGRPVSSRCKEEEDDYFFLMSLLPYIRALAPIEKLELRSTMQYLVTEVFRRRDLNQSKRVKAGQ